MPSPEKLLRKILTDMKVELAEMFDRNFEREGFFGDKWEPRKIPKPGYLVLQITSEMRKSIRAAIAGRGVRFTSSLPHTGLHNEGGKFTQNVRTHTRKGKSGKRHTVKAHTRTMTMPRRQFIGDHPEVAEAIETIIRENLQKFFEELAKEIKQ